MDLEHLSGTRAAQCAPGMAGGTSLRMRMYTFGQIPSNFWFYLFLFVEARPSRIICFCRKWCQRPALLDAVTLRMHGATGAVSAIPFLQAAMAEHFGGKPHFFLDERYRARKAQEENEKILLGPSSATRTIRVF